MYFLKESLRKIFYYIYQSRAKKYLRQFLLRATDSRFNAVQKLAWTLINSQRDLRDYFKITINTESIEGLHIAEGRNMEEELHNISPELKSEAMRSEKIIAGYPKISIVTPNYNQGKFLEGCIQSVLYQNYPNLEYIIMDGGSTDNSTEIIKKYGDNLYYWVSEKDNGQADAINKGLEIATGEIFNWLNSDDRLKPEALFKCAEAYREEPSAVGWVGACSRIDEKGNEVEIIFPNGLDRDNIGENWNGRQFYQPSCFLSTEKVKEIGGLNPDLYIALDLDLWIRILEKGRFVAGRGLWSEAINHDDAKTQKSIEKMVCETADLQRKYGFFGGAEKRYNTKNGKSFEYTLPNSLKERMAKLNNSPEMSENSFNANFNKRKNICFIGDFDTKQDVDAVIYFLREIFPIISKRNWVEFHVIGNNANKYKGLLKLHNVKFINKVEISDEVLKKYKLFVCPMTCKGGMKGKISFAATAGLPVVTTSIGAEGFPVRDGEECFIADSPIEFGEKCTQCLNDPIAWHNFNIKSKLMIAENFNPYKGMVR